MDILKKNDVLEAQINSLSSNGFGVCKINGRAVFVKHALPAEVWKIRILKANKTAVWAKAEELLSAPSAMRKDPACPIFGKCGGCDFLHLDYEAELDVKLDWVNSAFERIAKTDLRCERIIPSPETWNYRNKTILAVGKKDGKAFVGYYRSGTNDIVPVSLCCLADERLNLVSDCFVGWLNESAAPVYDAKTGRPGISHIFLRRSSSGEVLLCVVSSCGLGDNTHSLVKKLSEEISFLSGVVLNINKNKHGAVLGDKYYTLYGTDILLNSLCGFSFKISPQSFYQINEKQCENLYAVVSEMAQSINPECILDLYCGVGTISLCLSKIAKTVIGAEIVPQAIINARENAKLNNITNTEFICADAALAALELRKRGIEPDCVVVDPPRRGMDEAAISAVCDMKPKQVIYVSCNPSTLARDIALFKTFGYKAIRAVAADMFPKTAHVETVVLMSRVEK